MGQIRHFKAMVLAVAALAGLFAVAIGSGSYRSLREAAFDAMLGMHRPSAAISPPVIVVDIDRATLAAFGPWPWSRDRLAALVRQINTAHPRVLGLDILIEGPDERSPAALARKLAEVTGRAEFAAAALRLADGDAMLIAALKSGPSVLGIALDPDGAGNAPPSIAVLVGGSPDLSGLWNAMGAIGPIPELADAAAGLGILALPGDGDGRIRSVPLLAMAGDNLRPGLAIEMVRIAAGNGTYVLDGATNQLRIGSRAFGLAGEGMLRLRPADENRHATRTISAASLAGSAEARARLKGAIVLLGSSAPEVGGLRPAASGDLVASVQLQADAVGQLLADDLPHRPRLAGVVEVLVMAVMAIVAAWSAVRQSPLRAASVTLGLALAWSAIAIAALELRHWLIDPMTPALTAGTAFAMAAFLAASRTRIREAAIRRRFEQQLPAAVVSRLLDEPGLLKLEGEARRVTALFTDIEGFTAMTERAGPRKLVHLLDRYFDGLVRIVVEHGGMVEKIVGDGLHAIFNAPLDLDDHPAKAFACALAIEAFADRFRAEGDALALGFGATRIGIETGDVIVGDVGGGRRLDYTAHGNAMNTASRLEAANKDLGSHICVGPVAAAAIAPELLRPLGQLSVRGRAAPLAVFEPWPPVMSRDDRAAFNVAARLAAIDPGKAAAQFEALAARYPNDTALARLVIATARSATPP